jgi:alpha-tubulin suppressor-like RCC1 family protein
MASAGSNFVCAVFRDDGISCWGDNTDGQIGDGTQDGPRLTPTPPVSLSDVQHVSTGRNHACVTMTTGSLRCWGDNIFGEIGDGTTTVRPTNVPVDVGGPAVFVRTGNDHTCAALRSAQVWCWGFNDSGQLGDRTTDNSNVPVRVKGL